MGQQPGHGPNVWPSLPERLLLEAALGGAERAIPAFHAWRSQVDLEGELGWSVVNLLPLVYHNLHGHGVQDPAMGRFKGIYRRAWYETQRLFHQTAPAAAALVAHGIEVMLLDGVPLARSYYHHPALRPMTSISLLVRRPWARSAIQVLQAAGWWCTRDAADDHLRFADSLSFLGAQGGAVHLYWRVLEGSHDEGTDESFWQASEPVEWQGTPLRQLDATGLLTRALFEGVRWDGGDSLTWIPDALMVLRRRPSSIDWERFGRVADGQRMTHRLLLACTYLASTFGAEIPATVETRLASHRTGFLERVADATLLASRRNGVNRTPPGWRGLLAGYARYTARHRPGRNRVSLLLDFPHYLRYHWGLSSRREILPAFLRRLRSRSLPPDALPSQG
jgi:hypothetical protein